MSLDAMTSSSIRRSTLRRGAHGFAAACLLTTASFTLPLATASAAPVSSFAAAASEGDTMYLNHAMESMVFQTELAQLAREKGGEKVRAVGETVMMHDHGSLHGKITGIATRLGVQVNAEMSAESKAVVDSLRGKEGEEFDRAWAEAVVASHAGHLDMVRGHAAQAQDPEIKALANEELKTLEAHFGAMRGLAKEIGANVPKNINAGTGGGSDQSPFLPVLGAALLAAGAAVAGRSAGALRQVR